MPLNNVFVGLKPVMSYVTAIILHLNSGNNEVIVKARGKLAIKEISIGTKVLGQENERRNVSMMEIKLQKKD